MSETRDRLIRIRREHPVFFWGMTAFCVLLLAATAAVASRIPVYRADAAVLDARMSEAERQTRDRILESTNRRAELAIALWRRELQLKAMQQKGVHLALSVEDSVLELRHGGTTLRRVRVQVGPDSVVRAPDGRSWRFVRALGERHLQDKEESPVHTVPEWLYHSRAEPVPSEAERRVRGGLGRYVLRLDDGTEIHTPPATGPLVGTVRPASFVVAEEDLHAIYEAIEPETPVFIY